MPDLWMDVDTALSEVPINLIPLLDDTDFKSKEESVAYNAAGLDLVWNFVKTDGSMTQTAVTPTDTGGNYDWVNQGNGHYSIEIPASGGASINNDTEGFGWFTGVATGILPWRGPVIGFRASGLNDKLIDSAYSATRGLAGTALPDAAADAAGGLPISDAGGLDLDAQKTDVASILADTGTDGVLLSAGTGAKQISLSSGAVLLQATQTGVTIPTVTAVTNGVSIAAAQTVATVTDVTNAVKISAGTGAGQLDFTSGVVKANLAQILGTALTETAGQIAAAFKKFFNVATPTGTVNSIPDAVAGANGGLPTTNGTKVNQTVDLTAGQTIGTVTNLTNLPSAPTDWLTASAVKADAVTKIQNGLATPTNITAGTITTATNLTNLPTMPNDWLTAAGLADDAVNKIVDQVWNEATADHAVAGSTGAALTSAGIAGDPMSVAVPGSYGAGTAGKVLGDLAGTKDDTAAILLDTRTDGVVLKAAGLATDAVEEIRDAIFAKAVEGTYTLDQLMQIMSAMLAGKVTGGGTGTITVRDINDTADRLVFTANSNGNRTVVITVT